ncbi:MAG: hypothetical protein QXK37_04270 [Candidatus Woesearchaeota archaeon]
MQHQYPVWDIDFVNYLRDVGYLLRQTSKGESLDQSILKSVLSLRSQGFVEEKYKEIEKQSKDALTRHVKPLLARLQKLQKKRKSETIDQIVQEVHYPGDRNDFYRMNVSPIMGLKHWDGFILKLIENLTDPDEETNLSDLRRFRLVISFPGRSAGYDIREESVRKEYEKNGFLCKILARWVLSLHDMHMAIPYYPLFMEFSESGFTTKVRVKHQTLMRMNQQSKQIEDVKLDYLLFDTSDDATKATERLKAKYGCLPVNKRAVFFCNDSDNRWLYLVQHDKLLLIYTFRQWLSSLNEALSIQSPILKQEFEMFSKYNIPVNVGNLYQAYAKRFVEKSSGVVFEKYEKNSNKDNANVLLNEITLVNMELDGNMHKATRTSERDIPERNPFLTIDKEDHINAYIKDYITTPKTNGYSAIHLCLMFGLERGTRFECQIRDAIRDHIAARGEASHTKYRSEKEKKLATVVPNFEEVLWLANALLGLEEKDKKAFVDLYVRTNARRYINHFNELYVKAAETTAATADEDIGLLLESYREISMLAQKGLFPERIHMSQTSQINGLIRKIIENKGINVLLFEQTFLKANQIIKESDICLGGNCYFKQRSELQNAMHITHYKSLEKLVTKELDKYDGKKSKIDQIAHFLAASLVMCYDKINPGQGIPENTKSEIEEGILKYAMESGWLPQSWASLGYAPQTISKNDIRGITPKKLRKYLTNRLGLNNITVDQIIRVYSDGLYLKNKAN